MTPAARLDRLIERAEDYALPALLMLIVALNATNVFLRYVVGRSAGQLFELMVLLSLVIYWIGVATAERRTGHLGMTFLVVKLRGRIKAAASALRTAAIIGFLVAVVISGAQLSVSQYHSGTVSGALELRIWWFSLFIPLGALLMGARLLWKALRAR